MPKSVLLTGDFDHHDFRHVVASLSANARLAGEPNLQRAAQRLSAAGPAPPLIVVAQSRPGRFSAREIEQLHQAAPLSRLVALLGTWCEGEARSGRPWPGVERIYWHEWPARMAAWLESTDVCPAPWSVPRTATAVERLLARPAAGGAARRGLLGIHSATRAGYAALAETCRAWGYATVWLSPRQDTLVAGVEALLWDGASGDAAEAIAIMTLAERLSCQTALALLTFPRREDVERLQSAGVAAVLSKPWMNNDLLHEVDRLLESAPHVVKQPAAA